MDYRPPVLIIPGELHVDPGKINLLYRVFHSVEVQFWWDVLILSTFHPCFMLIFSSLFCERCSQENKLQIISTGLKIKKANFGIFLQN